MVIFTIIFGMGLPERVNLGMTRPYGRQLLPPCPGQNFSAKAVIVAH